MGTVIHRSDWELLKTKPNTKLARIETHYFKLIMPATRRQSRRSEQTPERDLREDVRLSRPRERAERRLAEHRRRMAVR
jgi:hypothetical protein